jgi:hypothetical protein
MNKPWPGVETSSWDTASTPPSNTPIRIIDRSYQKSCESDFVVDLGSEKSTTYIMGSI